MMTFEWLLDFFNVIVGFTNTVWGLLTYNLVTIGGTDITIMGVLGGAGLIVLISAILVKAVTPFL